LVRHHRTIALAELSGVALSPQHFRNSSTTPVEKKENQYEKKRKGSV